MELDLIHAAEEGDLLKVTDLLNQGININSTDSSEETPILKAARSGHDRIVDFLLERGADPNIRNSQGSTPLIEGAYCGHTQIVKLLLANGANPNARDLDGNSSLSLAVGQGQDPIVNLLIQSGAHADLVDSDGDTPLILAAKNGNVQMLDLLVKMSSPEGDSATPGVSCNSLRSSERPFEIRLSRPSEKVKRMHYRGMSNEPSHPYDAHHNDLIRRVDLSAKNGDGDTALIEAARNGYPDVVKILLGAGAQVDEVNLRGQTALLVAAAGGHATVVELLLAYGADPRIAADNGDTAVMLAARNDFGHVIEKILPKPRRHEPYLKVAPSPLPRVPRTTDKDGIDFFRLNSLVEFLFELLGEPRLSDILLHLPASSGKGSTMERLRKILHEQEPDSVLQACLGHDGTLEAVTRLDLDSEAKAHGSAMSALLNHFGVPTQPKPVQIGPFQVSQILRKLERRISRSSDQNEIQGALLNACSAIEKLLKMTLWGWAQLIYGDRRDEKISEALNAIGLRNYRLDRLTFGHVAGIFRKLPEVVANSPQASLIESKLGRSQIYVPEKKKSPFAKWLDHIVEIRNKMFHDDGGHKLIAMNAELIDQITERVRLGERLVSELVEEKAIPNIGTTSEETRDQFGRLRYRIPLDDGDFIMVHSSRQLPLGRHFLYFGSQSERCLVDPLMLPLEQIEDVR